jgi:hypothetical protein
MDLELTQPLTKMSTRNLPGSKGRPTSNVDNLTPKETYNLEYLVPTVKHGGGSVILWAEVSWYSILLVPLLSFMAKLLQGSTWTGWVIRCIPWSKRYFRTMAHFYKTTIHPFTQLELFSYDLKSMKVNFNILLGQHNRQIWTPLNDCGEFWGLKGGTDSYL